MFLWTFVAFLIAALGSASAQSPGGAAPAAPGDFEYTLVRLPDSFGSNHVRVERANVHRDLAGRYRITGSDGQPVWRAFVRRKGTFAAIPVSGAIHASAHGIADDGTVVGRYSDTKGEHGFILSPSGEMTTVDAPGATATRMYDVGANGVISGSYKTTGLWQPAMWVRGTFTPLPAIAARLGADMAEGFGINDLGEVTGHYTLASEAKVPAGAKQKMYGFVYRDGAVVATLDFPGSGWMSCAFDSSTDREVVGHYVDTVRGGVSGFGWKDGRFFATLRVPGAVDTYPQTVLADGTFIGSAILPKEESAGFIATPRRR